MTDSRQYPLVVMTETEAATVARFGIGARFEAGTRTMFGHECKIVTDHELGRFAMFVDETDTERIAEALNGGARSGLLWSPAPEQGRVRVNTRSDVSASQVGDSRTPVRVSDTAREAAIRVLDELPLHSQDSRTKNDGIRIDALIALGWGPVVPVPTREQIEEWSFEHRPILSMKDGSIAGCKCMDRVFVTRLEDWDQHIADAVLALFSPVEGNTK